jgi:hypothetical protein
LPVGSRECVDVIKRGLGVKAKGRRISGTDDESELREPHVGLRAIILWSKTYF